MCSVREALVHANGVKVPDRRPTHDPDSKRPVYRKVEGRIRLFHEARLLIPVPDAETYSDRSDEALHAKLAREAQDDDVETDKSEIAAAFAVVRWTVRVGAYIFGDEGVVARERVGQEEAGG